MPKPLAVQFAKPGATPITIPRRRRAPRPVGPFTFLLLCALDNLPERERYGARIEEHISGQLGQLVDLAQVYVGLKRLEDKKLITGKPAPAPGGGKYTVTLYRLSQKGLEAMKLAGDFYRRVAAAAPD